MPDTMVAEYRKQKINEGVLEEIEKVCPECGNIYRELKECPYCLKDAKLQINDEEKLPEPDWLDDLDDYDTFEEEAIDDDVPHSLSLHEYLEEQLWP